MVARDDWMTPKDCIERARKTLGDIDLDPASSRFGNGAVRARAYMTPRHNGWMRGWGTKSAPSRVFCNPPGGRCAKSTLPQLFWNNAYLQTLFGHTKGCVFLAFQISLLRVAQRAVHPPPYAFPMCVPRRRIAFVDPTGSNRQSPRYDNAIIYLPGTEDRTEVFVEEFSDLGFVSVPRNLPHKG